MSKKYTKNGEISPLWIMQEQAKINEEREILMHKKINEINNESKLVLPNMDNQLTTDNYKKQIDSFIYELEKKNEALRQELELKFDFLISHSDTKEELEIAKQVLYSNKNDKDCESNNPN